MRTPLPLNRSSRASLLGTLSLMWIGSCSPGTPAAPTVDFMVPAKFAEVGDKTNNELRVDIARDYPDHVAFVRDLMHEFNLEEVEIPENPPSNSEPVPWTLTTVLLLISQ